MRTYAMFLSLQNTLLCFCVLWLFASNNSRAGISLLKLKDVHSIWAKGCHSPIDAFTALETGQLENIRFRVGKYGPSRAPFPCYPQVIEAGRGQIDCPGDWSSTLIQYLFPSPDGHS